MKKLYFVFLAVLMMGALLEGCGTRNESADSTNSSEVFTSDPSECIITEEKAYEGVERYCRSMYDWSIAEDNPDMMYLEMGEETESEYQVIFRSYTGALVYFYVDKSSGTTRLIEYVPSLEIEEEAGTIDLFEYLE